MRGIALDDFLSVPSRCKLSSLEDLQYKCGDETWIHAIINNSFHTPNDISSKTLRDGSKDRNLSYAYPYEKTLQIFNNQRNKNANSSEILPHTYQIDKDDRKWKITIVGRAAGK